MFFVFCQKSICRQPKMLSFVKDKFVDNQRCHFHSSKTNFQTTIDVSFIKDNFVDNQRCFFHFSMTYLQTPKIVCFHLSKTNQFTTVDVSFVKAKFEDNPRLLMFCSESDGSLRCEPIVGRFPCFLWELSQTSGKLPYLTHITVFYIDARCFLDQFFQFF